MCMTHCPGVMLCDLTTCYSIKSAWCQRLELKCDEPLSSFAFNFNLRRYVEGEWIDDMIEGSGRYSYADKSYYQVGRPHVKLLVK